MTEQNQQRYLDPQDETDDALANLPAAAAAHLRHLQENMKAKAQQGAEKWEAISARLLEQIGEGDFRRWFSAVKPALTANAEQPPHLRLSFPTGFMRDWVEAHYGDFVRVFWRIMEPSGTLEFAIQPAEEPPPAKRPTAKAGQIIPFPVFPTETRPIVNEIARSALFPAIQGKDRQWLKNEVISSTGDSVLIFTGEQLNQDDHDVLMQLAVAASGRPAGEYIPVSGHSLLKALGRNTGGAQHKQLDAEIKRLTAGLVEIKTARYTYFGHLIDDAVKDEKTKNWVYRLNEKLRPCYEGKSYTLIDWEGRKQLKGKDLARWIQLYLATHAEPFPVKVETLHRLSGSRALHLRSFRQQLRKALADLQAAGHIKAWRIDERDLVTVERGDAISASQQRHLDPPPRRR